jgi:hypothetical protein
MSLFLPILLVVVKIIDTVPSGPRFPHLYLAKSHTKENLDERR